jgi:hypothetical protein
MGTIVCLFRFDSYVRWSYDFFLYLERYSGLPHLIDDDLGIRALYYTYTMNVIP